MVVAGSSTDLNTVPALPPHTLEMLISESDIRQRVAELAAEITGNYPDPMAPLLLIGVLNGAALFLADLVRAIQRPVEFDFVAYSSYGSGTTSSGHLEVLKDLRVGVVGKDIVIVEDILDTGLTLHNSGILDRLRSQGARSVAICVLLNKSARRQVPVPVQYCGFEIEDRFVVGYGMDWAEQYRHLTHIAVVIPCNGSEAVAMEASSGDALKTDVAGVEVI